MVIKGFGDNRMKINHVLVINNSEYANAWWLETDKIENLF